MKAKELREKDVAGLEEEIKALQRAYFGVRMQKATQQITNLASIKLVRRSVARAKTILLQKQTAAAATTVK
jgi:large subunit ribosomal protein L29